MSDLVNVICTLAQTLQDKMQELENLQGAHDELSGRHKATCDDLDVSRRHLDSLQAECKQLRERLRTAEDKTTLAGVRGNLRLNDLLMALFQNPTMFDVLAHYMNGLTADDRANKIANIKRVREITGWGLPESKNFVEAYPQPRCDDNVRPCADPDCCPPRF
jgi:hypothetical protein